MWRPIPSESEITCPYPFRFVSYLTRFLLNFDDDFKAMYESNADGGPLGKLESPEFQQGAKFGKFARTVELSLRRFGPEDGGSLRLLDTLLAEYGSSFKAKRQLCILFALLNQADQQPVGRLRGLLQSVENASVASVQLLQGGELLAGANASIPEVKLSLNAPPPGEGGKPAQLSARLMVLNRTEGRFSLAAVDLKVGGQGYASDTNLSVHVEVPDSVTVVKAPRFLVKLSRPSKPSENEPPTASLRRKLTGLLPSRLLPTYSPKLGRLVPDQSVPLTPDPSPEEEKRRLDEVFGDGRQLDRFRADFVFADFDSTFGPVGLSPLERERRLSTDDYMRLAASGALANLAKALVFLPVANVKVRLQTDMALGGGTVAGAFAEIAQKESWGNFFRGLDVVCLCAIAFGVLSFGVKEFLQRELVIFFPGLNELLAVVVASAASVFTALIVATPLEVLTARVMAATSPSGARGGKEPPFWGISELGSMFQAAPDGLTVVQDLYKEYWLLVGKDLTFVVTKFIVFDSLREALLFLLPAFAESQTLLVACTCGAVAGALAAVVSHPIDTIFARRATGNNDGDLDLEQLFRGVGARVLIYSPGIALTFVVYDFVKSFLGVSSGVLLQTLDLLRPAA